MAASNLNKSVGAVFFARSTQRFLFLLRSGDRYNNTWAFVGGKVEDGEDIMAGLRREIMEEIGYIPEIDRYIPIEKFTNIKKGFEYHTYVAIVDNEFLPLLNQEHSGYAWTGIDAWPKPLHPGVFGTLKTDEILGKIRTIIDIF